MNRSTLPGIVALLLLLSIVTPGAAALAYATEIGDEVEWVFLSPDADTMDEGLHLTCITSDDLRDDPIAVDDPVNEHVQLSCEQGIGTYCDYPTWIPPLIPDPIFCGDASDIAPCHGILYTFTGTLRILPLEGGSFEVTYDGEYGDWEGTC